MNPISSWEALSCESHNIATDLSSKNFLPREDWESYQVAANQLVKQFEDLSTDAPLLKNRNIKQLQSKCHAAIETIRVRLDYFHPENNTDVKFKFYSTQIEHLRLRINQLEQSLNEGLGVDPQHGNLLTPHNKTRLIEKEIDLLKTRIEEIQLKQEALH